MDVCIEKENIFIFFMITWKSFLSNLNLIFEYSVRDKIRLDWKVYPSSLKYIFCIYYQLTTDTKITFEFVSLSLFDGSLA